MILPLLLLLASLLQQYGSEAESSHISKFNPPGVKEQNGEFSMLLGTFNLKNQDKLKLRKNIYVYIQDRASLRFEFQKVPL